MNTDPASLTTSPYWTTEFIGTGPYKLAHWETGSYIERLGGLTRHCETSTLLLHPAGERHAPSRDGRPL